MIRELIRRPSVPEVRRIQPHAQDSFLITDMGGLESAAQSAGVDDRYRRKLREGTPALTALAEKYMDRFENDMFVGRAWRNIDNVVGSAPNVPAVLAGVPNSMRMRVRTTSHTAPLTILFELTGSGGTMDTRAERGAAMLAMARLLINTRPVDLWMLTTYGRENVMDMLATRVDTMPMDLARVAALLCDEEVLHHVTTEVVRSVVSADQMIGGSGWSYKSADLERRWSGEAFRRLMSPSSELLFIPAAYLQDNYSDPEAWIKDMLVRYGMGAVVRNEEDE